MKHAERDFTASALELEEISFPTINPNPPVPKSATPAAPVAPAAPTPRSALTDPQELDLRGLAAPLPVLRAARALQTLASGQALRIAVDSASHVRDFEDLCALKGHRLHDRVTDEHAVHFTLTRK